MGYIAVGSGPKRENAARVYAGHYLSSLTRRRVPMLVIVKCGSDAEQTTGEGKPGNRGKRDSQMILMNFIMRVNYNERFTPLDFDLFRKVYTLCGVHADFFEAVLMVSPLFASPSETDEVVGRCGHPHCSRLSDHPRQLPAQRPRHHGYMRRNPNCQQTHLMDHRNPGLRVLHFAPSL